MENTYYRLTSLHTDLVIQSFPFAEIIWWGPHLKSFSSNDAISLQRSIANGRLDIDSPITLMAENGHGFFGSPGVEGHRNGRDSSPIFKTVSIEQHGQSLTLISEDPLAGLQLVSEFVLSTTGVLKIRHSLSNLMEEDWQVNRLAITLPISERAYEVMAFHGRWTREFQSHRIRLTHNSFVIENRRGRTSHEHFPALIVGTPGFNEMQGDIWAVHLGWSGNHRMKCEVKTDGRRYLQAEALFMPGEKSLQQGETIQTPWLYACHSTQGLNGMSQQFHQFLRNELIHFPINKPRPVHLNTWEGIYFEHNPNYIMQMASRAAELGVERFIIDDGWFKGRNDDHAALGDWYLDKLKYPDGLMPLIHHVKELGMEFGIWVEPEMVNPDSDLYRRHPDWILALPGYSQPTGRNQYVLNLNIPEVFEYLLERLSWLLGEHPIDYVKWDMNRELVQPYHQGQAAADSQTHQFYRLLDILRYRFPLVEFESCASGGGRIDYEVLTRTHRFWASDNNDALERNTIQRGMSYFFPLEVIGAHIGNYRCHATFRKHNIAFRGLTALFGHMGLELDPVTADIQEANGCQHYIELYQKWRQLIHTGTLWRIDMPDNTTQAQSVVSQDGSQSLIMISQLAMPDYTFPSTLRLPGLNPESRYRICVEDANIQLTGEGGHTMRKLPGWMEHSTSEIGGEWLAQIGLQLPILDPETALLISVTQI